MAVTPVERTTNLAREMVMKSACLNSSGIRLSRIPIILGSCFRLLPGFFRRRLFFSFRRFLMRNRFCQLRRRCCWRLFEPEPPRLLASTSRFDRRWRRGLAVVVLCLWAGFFRRYLAGEPAAVEAASLRQRAIFRLREKRDEGIFWGTKLSFSNDLPVKIKYHWKCNFFPINTHVRLSVLISL